MHLIEDPNTVTVDIAAVGIAFGALVNALPAVASILSIIWFLIRIWETDTVKQWTGRLPQPKENDDDE